MTTETFGNNSRDAKPPGVTTTQPAGGAGFLRINAHLITGETGSANEQHMGMTNHDTVIHGQGFAIRTLAVLSTIVAVRFRSAV